MPTEMVGPLPEPIATAKQAEEEARKALEFYGIAPDDLAKIEETLLMSFVWVDDDTRYSWETRDALHTGLVLAYAESVRATVRAEEAARYAALVEAAEAMRGPLAALLLLDWREIAEGDGIARNATLKAMESVGAALDALREVEDAKE